MKLLQSLYLILGPFSQITEQKMVKGVTRRQI
jgi:hypothetical protein